MKYVIIGNSYAGIGAVESIRETDEKGEIIIISEEPYKAYARPLISYFLAGRVKARGMYYRDADFYRRNNVTLLLGEKAAGVDTKEQAVYMENGAVLDYDRLLISSGGRPSVHQIGGINAKNIFCFTRWDDAKKLREAARKKKKAVVLGGGLIGLKAAEGLNAIGVDVTIIISSPRVLSLVLDETSGRIINRQLMANKIKLMTGHSAKEVLSDSTGEVCGIVLGDNRKLDCGILIVAKGVRPNIELTRDTAIATARGIIVDRHMKTSAENVYAAGDVAEAWDLLNRKNTVIAIAPLAYEQGRIAGYNMTGEQRLYAGGIGMNSIEAAGLPVMAMGISNRISEGMEVESYCRGKLYRKLVFNEGRLAGAILVGDVRYGGVLTHLIRSQRDIGHIKKKLVGYGLKTGEFIFPDAVFYCN